MPGPICVRPPVADGCLRRARRFAGVAIVHHTFPASSPLVVLTLGTMAYDIALRALPPHRPTAQQDSIQVLLGPQ